MEMRRLKTPLPLWERVASESEPGEGTGERLGRRPSAFPCGQLTATTRLAALATAFNDASEMLECRPTPNTVVPSSVTAST